VIETVLSVFEMQVKGMPGYSIELNQPPLDIAPEALDAIDMDRAPGKFVVAVTDPKVLVKADIDQTVTAAPAIRVDHAVYIGAAPDDGLQGALARIRHDLGMNRFAPLEQTEDNGFSARAASS
jgi:hypothetical protein